MILIWNLGGWGWKKRTHSPDLVRSSSSFGLWQQMKRHTWRSAVGASDGFCVFSCSLLQTEALHHQPNSSLFLFTSVYSHSCSWCAHFHLSHPGCEYIIRRFFLFWEENVCEGDFKFFDLPASFHQDYKMLFWKTCWNTGDKTSDWWGGSWLSPHHPAVASR